MTDAETTATLPLKRLDRDLWQTATEQRPGGFDARDARGRRIRVTFDPKGGLVHYVIENAAGHVTAVYYTTMQELAGCVLDAHQLARSIFTA